MICEWCRYALKPGFVWVPLRGGQWVPCPSCQGSKREHCCEGDQAQPEPVKDHD